MHSSRLGNLLVGRVGRIMRIGCRIIFIAHNQLTSYLPRSRGRHPCVKLRYLIHTSRLRGDNVWQVEAAVAIESTGILMRKMISSCIVRMMADDGLVFVGLLQNSRCNSNVNHGQIKFSRQLPLSFIIEP